MTKEFTTSELDNLKERITNCVICKDVGFCWNTIDACEMIEVINKLKKMVIKDE